ncbi:hypothetical protein [Methylopila musalis]
MSWHTSPSTSPFAHLSKERALACAKEFMADPIGHHSLDLQRILHRFRGSPLEGRWVLVQTKPFEEWRLGRMNGRAKPIEIFEDKVFTSHLDGEREIFRLMWKQVAGESLSF